MNNGELHLPLSICDATGEWFVCVYWPASLRRRGGERRALAAALAHFGPGWRASDPPTDAHRRFWRTLGLNQEVTVYWDEATDTVTVSDV